MRYFILSALSAAVLAVGFNIAQAAQDTPMSQNGVTAVCTGVGSAKDNPEWKSYPVKIVLATTGGANLAAAHITLTGGGKTLVETDCDAPWILFKAPAGKYTATAMLNGGSGQSHSTSFSTDGNGPQKELTITFARPAAQP